MTPDLNQTNPRTRPAVELLRDWAGRRRSVLAIGQSERGFSSGLHTVSRIVPKDNSHPPLIRPNLDIKLHKRVTDEQKQNQFRSREWGKLFARYRAENAGITIL